MVLYLTPTLSGRLRLWASSTCLISGSRRSVFHVRLLDDLNILAAEAPTGQKPQMSIAWHNGEFVRIEISAEELKARKKYLDDIVVEVKKNCEVEPVNGSGSTHRF